MKLSQPDLDKFRDMKTEVFVLNLGGSEDRGHFLNNRPAKEIREKFKLFWRDLGYRYGFKVNKVTIWTDTGEITKCL